MRFRENSVKNLKRDSKNLVPTTEEVREVLNEITVRGQMIELKMLGMFDKNRTKPRTLLVTSPRVYDARQILANAHKNRKQLAQKEVYLLPALNKENYVRENMCIKKRRKIIDDGVPKEKVGILNSSMTGKNGDRIKPKNGCVTKFSYFSLHEHNCLLNITGRSNLSNAVPLFGCNIFCLAETWLTKIFQSSDLLLNNYTLYRSDRDVKIDEKSAHGGVLIALKTEIDSQSIKSEITKCCIAVKV